MTDTTNAALPAGRELDVCIERDVMGTELVTVYGVPWRKGSGPVREFSTDWDAMRLVVERLVALGWNVTMNAGGVRPYCSLMHGAPDWHHIDRAGDTLPHAVALAALAAVRAQQNPEAEHE